MFQRFQTFQAHTCGEVVAHSCSREKVILKNFAMLSQESTSGWRSVNLLKKRLRHNCFPVNSAKSVRTSILKDFWGRRWTQVGLTAKLIKTLRFSNSFCELVFRSVTTPNKKMFGLINEKTFSIKNNSVYSI